MKFSILKTSYRAFRRLNSRHQNFTIWSVIFFVAFELGAFGSNLIFGDRYVRTDIVPTTSPFLAMNFGFGVAGPKAPRPARERLMEIAHKLSRQTGVPYVFGGHQIGSSRDCQECSDCIRKNRYPANSTMVRYESCSACQRCGVDCSNFVNRLFAEAGLKYRFATSRTLNVAEDDSLQEQYGFVNVGTDLRDARPGDLLLKKGHVVMLIDLDYTLRTVDFIHASRGSKRTPVGGIELRRGMDMEKMQRDTVRILRHRDLVLPEDSNITLSAAKAIWAGMRRLMASNH